MNLRSSTILLPALRSLLVNQLQKAIKIQDWMLQKNAIDDSSPMEHEHWFATGSSVDIPLNKVREVNTVWYVSAIALKLAKPLEQSAIEVAHEIHTILISQIQGATDPISHPLLERIWTDFSIDVAPPGWLYFRLNDCGLARWLDGLIRHPLSLPTVPTGSSNSINNNQFLRNSTNLFTIQYTHARCCSLLQQAAADQLITLSTTQLSPGATQCSLYIPESLPWLNTSGHLRLQHPMEQQLMAQLIITLDGLADWLTQAKLVSTANLAQELSKQFQLFYAACRIWGDVKLQTPELAQTRLGLVQITQMLLRLLLEDCLGAVAPITL